MIKDHRIGYGGGEYGETRPRSALVESHVSVLQTGISGRPNGQSARRAGRMCAPKNRIDMNEKLPAPCEHCSATGIFNGIECDACRGKGYRLIADIKKPPRPNARPTSG